ncbi:hypothetical protein BDV06DRAFT_222671 [Aspergillus oleicola]
MSENTIESLVKPGYKERLVIEIDRRDPDLMTTVIISRTTLAHSLDVVDVDGEGNKGQGSGKDDGNDRGKDKDKEKDEDKNDPDSKGVRIRKRAAPLRTSSDNNVPSGLISVFCAPGRDLDRTRGRGTDGLRPKPVLRIARPNASSRRGIAGAQITNVAKPEREARKSKQDVTSGSKQPRQGISDSDSDWNWI